MTAYHFTIATDARLLAHALIAPAARYVSILWRGAERIDRRFVKADAWPHVEADLQAGWSKGLVSTDSHVWRSAFAFEDPDLRGVKAQFVTSPPIDASEPMQLTAKLDAYLRAQVFV